MTNESEHRSSKSQSHMATLESDYDLNRMINEFKMPIFDSPLPCFDQNPLTFNQAWQKIASDILSPIPKCNYTQIAKKMRNLDNDVLFKKIRKVSPSRRHDLSILRDRNPFQRKATVRSFKREISNVSEITNKSSNSNTKHVSSSSFNPIHEYTQALKSLPKVKSSINRSSQVKHKVCYYPGLKHESPIINELISRRKKEKKNSKGNLIKEEDGCVNYNDDPIFDKTYFLTNPNKAQLQFQQNQTVSHRYKRNDQSSSPRDNQLESIQERLRSSSPLTPHLKSRPNRSKPPIYNHPYKEGLELPKAKSPVGEKKNYLRNNNSHSEYKSRIQSRNSQLRLNISSREGRMSQHYKSESYDLKKLNDHSESAKIERAYLLTHLKPIQFKVKGTSRTNFSVSKSFRIQSDKIENKVNESQEVKDDPPITSKSMITNMTGNESGIINSINESSKNEKIRRRILRIYKNKDMIKKCNMMKIVPPPPKNILPNNNNSSNTSQIVMRMYQQIIPTYQPVLTLSPTKKKSFSNLKLKE